MIGTLNTMAYKIVDIIFTVFLIYLGMQHGDGNYNNSAKCCGRGNIGYPRSIWGEKLTLPLGLKGDNLEEVAFNPTEC